MLTTFQKQKQTHYFNLVDGNKDGYMVPEDWLAIGRNLAAVVGLEQGTMPYEGLIATIGTVWDNLAPFLSDPNKLTATLDEWLQFEDEMAVNCDDAWYDHYVTKIVQGVFDLLDPSGNGVLEENEYIDIMVCFRVEPRNGSAGFRRIDTNEDGMISRREFEQAVREFHQSDEPDSPGNWFFGPLPTEN